MREAILRSSLLVWLTARAHAGWFGRTSMACSQAGPDAILPPSYRSCADGRSPFPTEDGATPGSSPTPPDASGWRGECLTLSMPAFPNFQGRSRSEGSVSSLSEVLVRGSVPRKYYLTASCAEGILRRAERKGKTMPQLFRAALEILSGRRKPS